MKNQQRWAAAAAALMLAPALASAQLFKCQDASGKTVFSDTRCEGPAAAPPKPATDAKAAGGRYQLTESDNERVRKLEAGLVTKGGTDEQKTAASLELSSIRSGQDARLTPDARAKREALVADLASSDTQKRKDSLNKLRELYSNF